MKEQGTVPQEPGSVVDGDEPALASEISRRVGAILDAVEREAARLREEAQADAARYVEEARRRADALVVERQRRIAELSDDLMAKSEAVVARLEDAAPVREGFEHLVRALGDAAERLSEEADAEPSEFAPPPYSSSTAAEPRYASAPPEQPEASPPPAMPPPAVPTPPPASPYAPPATSPPVAGTFEEQPHPAQAPASAGFAAGDGRIPSQQPAPVRPPPGAAPAPRATWRELDDARMVAIQMATAGSTRAEVRDHLQRALGIVDPNRTLDEIFGPGSSEEQRVPWTGSRG